MSQLTRESARLTPLTSPPRRGILSRKLPMAESSSAAIRQLPLSFEELPLWDVLSLQSALAGETGRPIELTLTDNRSVLLSFRRHAGAVRLRPSIHAISASAN